MCVKIHVFKKSKNILAVSNTLGLKNTSTNADRILLGIEKLIF